MAISQGDRLEREQHEMKKDLAEVKAYAEAMAGSNRARDAELPLSRRGAVCGQIGE